MTDEHTMLAQEKMDKTIAVFKQDLVHIRAGRANAQVLDRVMVDYYGTATPIMQVGNISTPEPRLLVISPWDAKMISEIEKAIQKSDLGIHPSNDGKVVRLVFPELTQERRKELVKVVKKHAEEAKVAIRAIRRDTNDQLKKACKQSEITEDDLRDLEKEMQNVTDKHIENIDKLAADKEKEILEL